MDDPTRVRIEKIRRNNNGAGKVLAPDVAFLLDEIKKREVVVQAARELMDTAAESPGGGPFIKTLKQGLRGLSASLAVIDAPPPALREEGKNV